MGDAEQYDGKTLPQDDSWQAELLERVGIGAFRINHVTGTFAAANEAAARILGFPSAQAMIGESALGTFQDEEERAEAVSRIYNNPAVKARGYLRAEVQRKRRDTGEPVDLLMSLALKRNEAGEVVQAEGLLEDIGTRKQAEKTFRSGAERFKVIFETSPLGMVLASPDGIMGRINEAFCRFLGRSVDQCRGRPFTEFVDQVDRDQVSELLHHHGPAEGLEGAHRIVGDDGSPASFEWRFVRPDGDHVWGRGTAFWLTDDEVAHSRVIMVEDISRHKEMEENLLRMEKLNAIGLLAGGLAHDFNNILAIVMGNVALARSNGSKLAIDAHMDAVENACARARDLTNQLITFARGGKPLRRPTNLELQATAAAELCFKGTNIRARIDVEPDLLAADVDPGQIGQVFQNLFLNARDAGGPEATVTVTLRNLEIKPEDAALLPYGHYLEVSVADQGPGISKQDLARVFDPYFTTKNGGTGLGLASVYSIVRSHDGTISASSPAEGGALFRFVVPATTQRPMPPDEAAWPAAPRQEFNSSAKILVMDDNLPVQEVLVGILERAGYEVEATANGEEALQRFREAEEARRPFDLAVLDLMVQQGMGGIETLRALRALKGSVKAIVCSGYSADPVISEYRAHGFQGVVPKPFAATTLLNTVRSVLLTPNV